MTWRLKPSRFLCRLWIVAVDLELTGCMNSLPGAFLLMLPLRGHNGAFAELFALFTAGTGCFWGVFTVLSFGKTSTGQNHTPPIAAT